MTRENEGSTDGTPRLPRFFYGPFRPALARYLLGAYRWTVPRLKGKPLQDWIEMECERAWLLAMHVYQDLDEVGQHEAAGRAETEVRLVLKLRITRPGRTSYRTGGGAR